MKRDITAIYAQKSTKDDMSYLSWIDSEAGVEQWDELKWRTAYKLQEDGKIIIVTAWLGDGTIENKQAELVPVRRIGYVIFADRPDEWIEVKRIVVHPNFRNDDVGKYLINRGKTEWKYYMMVNECDLDTQLFLKKCDWTAKPQFGKMIYDGTIRFERNIVETTDDKR